MKGLNWLAEINAQMRAGGLGIYGVLCWVLPST